MAKSTFWQDFKKFATKGNVVDMAVGVIVGGAFSKIVSSLVADIITPCISLLTGKADFKELVYVLKEGTDAVLAEDGVTVLEEAIAPITLNYGTFLQYIFDFLIIALSIFVALRVVTGFHRRSEKLKAILDAENWALEQKKAAEEAEAKAKADAEAAEKAKAEAEDIVAARKAQQETAALLSEIKEILAKK